MGFMSLILSPFILIFLLIYFIFRHGEVFIFKKFFFKYFIKELRNRPGIFLSRQWSPMARWKFRELNELPHVFQKRLNASYNFAQQYVDSFSFNKLTIIAR